MHKKKRKHIISLELFKEPFVLANKNKGVTILIALMQVLFLLGLFVVVANYSVPISESFSSIMDYVEAQDLTEETVSSNIIMQKGVLGDDPLLIYREYQNITSSLRYMLFFILAIFIVFNGLNWVLSDSLIAKKKPKTFFIYLLKFLTIFISYFIIMGLIVIGLSGTISINEFDQAALLPLIGILASLLIVSYFMFISLALIGKNKPLEIIKKTFIIGIKKVHIILLVYLINFTIFGVVGTLFYLSAEFSIFLIIPALLLFIIVFIYKRILFMSVIKRIDG